MLAPRFVVTRWGEYCLRVLVVGQCGHPAAKVTKGEILAQACHSSFDMCVPCQLAGDVMGGPV